MPHPQARSRRPVFAAAVVAALVCALGAGVAIVDPFHLRYDGELTAVGVAGFFLFLAVTFALAPFPTGARIGAAVGAGVLGLALFVSHTFVMTVFTDRTSVIRSTRADNGHELVVLWQYYSVDRIPEIRLRRGTGPFSQESVVYTGPIGSALPTNVRFSAANRVTYTVGDCTFGSGYDPWTLKVDHVHVHRPGC